MNFVLDLPVTVLRGKSFQALIARLPIKERGMGLRSLVDIIPTNFLGSLEMSLPFLSDQGGQCQLQEPLFGNMRAAEERSKWRTLLQFGCRTGRELE